jgi:membrane-associated phospholipid phosphatase
MRMLELLSELALLGAVLLPSGVASAEETPPPKPLRWEATWSHAGPWDYTLTGVGLTTLGVETVFLQNHTPTARWISPILFDDSVWQATHGTTNSVRDGAAAASWGFWFAEMGYPLVIDVPYAWARYGKGVAWDLFWQSATALSLSGAFDFAMRDVIGRVRPANYYCLRQGGTDCLDGPESRRSFPSGHFTETTTATALICTQHLKMHLYGAPWDAVTCGGAIGADVAVGTLRLVADDHWATDLVSGGVLGFLFGWGVPTLMHMHGVASRTAGGAPMPTIMIMPAPIPVDHGAGLGATGIF